MREALQRPAGLGLLRFETNRGAVVPTLTADDAEESYALRRAIEPKLLRRAIPRLSIVELAEAEVTRAPRTGRRAARDAMSGTEANWAFHRAQYRASGWDRGLAMAEILHAGIAPHVALYTQGLGAVAISASEHAALLDACRAGDARRAVSLLTTHLDAAADAVVRFLRTEG